MDGVEMKFNADELNAILDDENAKIQKVTKMAEEKCAAMTAAAIRAAAPRSKTSRSGSYANGWSVRPTPDGTGLVVYNKDNYQLTHLLEKGHAKVNGGRVAPRIHIRPAEERGKNVFVVMIKNGIQNGA